MEASDWKKEAAPLLAQIVGKHSAKKRATILALVEARLRGEAEETVWGLPQTCSRTTYHHVKRRADGTKRGWKYDPVFSKALIDIETLAREWHSNLALAQLEERQKEWAEKTHDIGVRLIEKAMQMLAFPLQKATMADGLTTIEPAKWHFGTIPGIVTTADKLVRLSLGMPTDVKHNLVGAAPDVPPIDVSAVSQATTEELKSMVNNSTFLLDMLKESESISHSHKEGNSPGTDAPPPDDPDG